jgi:ABC-type branched-subunit amino acid transport system permease subunit
MTADRLLLGLVRVNAAILLLAAPCTLLPFDWMNAIHRELLGLGELPNQPIVLYMARSLALTYALHGAVVLGVTLGWPRYRPAVPYLAMLHILFGLSIVAIDLSASLPWWWTLGEGGSAIFGLVVLVVSFRASRTERTVP